MARLIGVALASFCVGFLSYGLLFAGGDTVEQGDRDTKLAIAAEMIEAWDTKNWERVAELFTADGVLHSMMQEPIVGRQSIRTRVLELGAGVEEIKLNIRNIGVVNDVVVLERLDEFVYNGHEGAVPVVGILEFEGNLIKEWREYYDHRDLLAGMGLLPDADHSGEH